MGAERPLSSEEQLARAVGELVAAADTGDPRASLVAPDGGAGGGCGGFAEGGQELPPEAMMAPAAAFEGAGRVPFGGAAPRSLRLRADVSSGWQARGALLALVLLALCGCLLAPVLFAPLGAALPSSATGWGPPHGALPEEEVDESGGVTVISHRPALSAGALAANTTRAPTSGTSKAAAETSSTPVAGLADHADANISEARISNATSTTLPADPDLNSDWLAPPNLTTALPIVPSVATSTEHVQVQTAPATVPSALHGSTLRMEDGADKAGTSGLVRLGVSGASNASKPTNGTLFPTGGGPFEGP